MKNTIISVVLGFIIAACFFLQQKERIVYVPKVQEKIVEKIVEVEVPVEKIVYKKRSCKLSEEQRSIMCMDLLAQSMDEQKIDSEEEAIIASEYALKQPEIIKESKNRVSAHVGYGKNGFKTSFDGQRLNIENKKELIMGAQYQRKITDRWSGSLMIQSNDAAFVGAGFDY